MARRKGAFNSMPDAELSVMQGVWDLTKQGHKLVSGTQLMETFPDTIGKLKQTTVLTLLTRLSDMGYIEIEKDGRRNFYRAAITEEEYRKLAAANFVSNVCRNSTGSLLSALVAGGLVDDGDIEELRSLIHDKEGK